MAQNIALPTGSRRLKWYVWAVALASFGMNATFFVPLQNLLPRMIEGVISPADKGIVLGVITGAGALAALVANPIAGHFSDKRAGVDGRRSWLLAGLVLGTLGLLILAHQRSLWGVALVWVAVQVSVNAAYAPAVASVVDHIPLQEQGTVWGYISVARALGLIGGFVLLAVPPATIASGTTLVAALYALSGLPLALTIAGLPLVRASHGQAVKLTKLQVLAAARSHDFRAIFWVRLLMALASAIALTYLLYYLQDVLHVRRPNEEQAILIGLSTLTTIIAAVAAGKWSDKTGQRRRLLGGAIVLIILGGLLLAILPIWATTVAASLILGVSMGIFASAGQALTVRILPDVGSAGRDLGIMNIGNVVPQIIGPLIGSLLLSVGASYQGLFFFAAVLGAAALVVLRQVRDQP